MCVLERMALYPNFFRAVVPLQIQLHILGPAIFRELQSNLLK